MVHSYPKELTARALISDLKSAIRPAMHWVHPLVVCLSPLNVRAFISCRTRKLSIQPIQVVRGLC
jgi:hypothetical protein